jgi:uncharacterized protein
VNHFLLGLGMMQPKLAQVKGEVGEAIDDLRSIAQLGYDEDEDQEELAHSLEEVVEYVRVAAILCHTEFGRQFADGAGKCQTVPCTKFFTRFHVLSGR